MKNRLNKLSQTLNEDDMIPLLDDLEDFGKGAEITEDEQQRILSSVMKKAGFEMKDKTMVSVKTDNEEKKIRSKQITEVSRVKITVVSAACIVLALIGAFAASLMLGEDIKTGSPSSGVSGGPSVQTAQDNSDNLDEIQASVVPDVVGMNDEQARSALTQAGFLPIRTEIYNDDVEIGKVIESLPAHDENIVYEQGSSVRYFVSLGHFCTAEEVSRERDEAQLKFSDVLDRYNEENGCALSFIVENSEEIEIQQYLSSAKNELDKILGMDGDQFYQYLCGEHPDNLIGIDLNCILYDYGPSLSEYTVTDWQFSGLPYELGGYVKGITDEKTIEKLEALLDEIDKIKDECEYDEEANGVSQRGTGIVGFQLKADGRVYWFSDLPDDTNEQYQYANMAITVGDALYVGDPADTVSYRIPFDMLKEMIDLLSSQFDYASAVEMLYDQNPEIFEGDIVDYSKYITEK